MDFILGRRRRDDGAEREPLLRKQRLVVRVTPTQPASVALPPLRRGHPRLMFALSMTSPQRLRRCFAVVAILCAAIVVLGSLGGPKPTPPGSEHLSSYNNLDSSSSSSNSSSSARRGESGSGSARDDSSSKNRDQSASKTVRSRSIFTCCLCVAASVVILVPRLACGPDDERGLAPGPGRAEEYVSGELRAAATLLGPWLAVGVPWDLANRLVVRGAFPYPLSLTAVELGACVCLGACLPQTPESWWSRRSLTAYVPLGASFFLVTAGAREAARATKCGPRISAAFANAATGLVVLVLTVIVVFCKRDDQDDDAKDEEDDDKETTTAITTTTPSLRPDSPNRGGERRRGSQQQHGGRRQRREESEQRRRRLRISSSDDSEDNDDSSSDYSVSDSASSTHLTTVRRRRSGVVEEETDVDEDTDFGEGWCCCCLEGSRFCVPKIPGVPNCSAAVALAVALGGSAIMALGEASVGPVAPACVAVLVVAQVSRGAYYVGFQELLQEKTQQQQQPPKKNLARAFLVSSATAFALAAAAALGWELTAFSGGGGDDTLTARKRTVLDRPFGTWLVLLDVAAFAVLSYLALLVLERFSALVLVLFAAVRAVASTLAAAALFGDVVTNLEYKGAMILVLGQVIYALEVSKALLEDPPPRDPLPPLQHNFGPSPFLQRENDDQRRRLRRRQQDPFFDDEDEPPPPQQQEQQQPRRSRRSATSSSSAGGPGGLEPTVRGPRAANDEPSQ